MNVQDLHNYTAAAEAWHGLSNLHPEILSKTQEEFFKWASDNPQLNLDPTYYWSGNEAINLYSDQREKHEQIQQAQGGIDPQTLPSVLSDTSLLAIAVIFRQKPQIMEEDPEYQSLVKQNELIGPPTQAWMEYRYGSLTDGKLPGFKVAMEQKFREKHKKKADEYDKKKKKIYRNIQDDPAIAQKRREIEERTKAWIEFLKWQQNPALSEDQVKEAVQKRAWEHFVQENPEKAEAYLKREDKEYDFLKTAKKDIETRLQLEEYEKITQKENMPQTGKDIKYVAEKTHRDQDAAKRIEEASKKLETVASSSQQPKTFSNIQIPTPPPSPVGLVTPQGRPLVFSPSPSPSQSPPSAPSTSSAAPSSPRGPNIVDGANNAAGRMLNGLGNIKNLGKLLKGAKAAQTATGVGAAAAGGGTIIAGYALVIALVAVVIIVFIIVFSGGFGGIGSSPGTDSGTGTPTSTSLDYFINFKDPSVTVADPDAIKAEVRSRWPNAQLGNWGNIVSQSITHGWNPAFVLTLWIEETGAQGANSYADALGCDPSHPTTDINKSLGCLFKSYDSYTSSQFEDLMCIYGGDGFHKAPCTFNTKNPNFPPNIKSWYSKLVPSGPGVLIPIIPTKGTSVNTVTPPPSNPSTLKEDIQKKFNISMNGFDNQHLQWGWEQLWRLSNTNFIALTKGTAINSSPSSSQESCRVVKLTPFSEEELFKITFTHELGHIIKWCNPNSQSRIGDLPDIIEKESYVTYYSANASTCTGSDNFNEDYAEMITYYLNPSANSKTAKCEGNQMPNPYLGNKHPLHYNAAKDILGGL